MSIQDDWGEVRRHWRELEREPLLPEDVFDHTAQQRIGTTIAREAVTASQRVVKLKFSRRSESYCLLQAADAQDRAQRARSHSDRDAWMRIADKWLALLERMKASRDLVDERKMPGDGND